MHADQATELEQKAFQELSEVLARDTEIVPARPTLEFPKPSIQAKPYIRMRDIYTAYHTMMPPNIVLLMGDDHG